MCNLYNVGRVVVLGSLLVLGLAVGVSAPAWAVDVSGCKDFSTSNPNDTRFDLVQNITSTVATETSNTCLIFPPNAIVYMNGFLIVGRCINTGTTGIVLGDD